MPRGVLRIYLGASPGVGKTFAMLGEGQRRVERGTDVVVAFVEDHGRRHTAAMIDGLELVPRREVKYRGATFTEMDLDAVLARRPEVALVDELAHTNVPGGRHEKRWQDVETLLDAGIDVITTVNIQHLESLNDIVATITGVTQRETLSDEVARRAEQIELVDMTPEALRRRLAHGNVYKADKVDAALANYFRVGNLSALRELALLWLADRVDEGLEKYRAAHGITDTWPARERVVVALTGGPEGDTLVRHAARVAGRGAGGELMAVYVSRSDGLTGASPDLVARQRTLVQSLGGSFTTVVGDDAGEAVLDYARAVNASEIVIGASRRGRVAAVFSRGVGDVIIEGSGEMAVQVVNHEHVARGLLRGQRRRGLRRSRLVVGWVLAITLPVALTALLAATREAHSLPSELLLFLAVTVGVALVGGRWPAVACAVWSSLLANWFFTLPLYTLTIDEPENVVALLVSVLVGVAVASVVDDAARRSSDAARARAEADVLAELASSFLGDGDSLDALLRKAVETFGMDSAALLEQDDERGPWRRAAAPVQRARGRRRRTLPSRRGTVVSSPCVAGCCRRRTRRYWRPSPSRRPAWSSGRGSAGPRPSSTTWPTATGSAPPSWRRSPTTCGRRWPASRRPAVASGTTPCTSARPTAPSCSPPSRSPRTASTGWVANLLDLSRLQTDVVRPLTRAVSLDGVVAAALVGNAEVDGSSHVVTVEVPEDLPAVLADPGLLERVIANIVENGLRYGGDVRVVGSALRGRVELRVVDHGLGVPDSGKAAMFAPFQRLGDSPGGTGVGLGLAVARGLVELMGGDIGAEDTPGGGLTMVLSLPAAMDVVDGGQQAQQVRA